LAETRQVRDSAVVFGFAVAALLRKYLYQNVKILKVRCSKRALLGIIDGRATILVQMTDNAKFSFIIKYFCCFPRVSLRAVGDHT
jgi:hypothetical protein